MCAHPVPGAGDAATDQDAGDTEFPHERPEAGEAEGAIPQEVAPGVLEQRMQVHHRFKAGSVFRRVLATRVRAAASGVPSR